jgi:anaerobic selenocysteine-containing dehydrogenase
MGQNGVLTKVSENGGMNMDRSKTDEVVTAADGDAAATTMEGGAGAIEPAFEPEESVVGIYGGNCTEPGVIDVKNGKIVRIRPLHYDENYTKEELASNMWKYEARGKTLESRMQSMPSFFALAYKKRTYSPNRIRYPLKRVDWEPGGDPAKINPQNRGKSKFKRISWDEATTLIASEIKRVQDTYGTLAVLDASDSYHRDKKTIQGGMGSVMVSILLKNLDVTRSVRNADSWEGWYYGSMHIWGQGAVGMLPASGFFAPGVNQTLDVQENTEMLIYQGCDWDTTSYCEGGWASRLPRWYNHLGIKQVYIAPEVNWQNVSNPDKWIPVLPGRDDALELAIIYTWIKEGTYDKDYIATHTIGFDEYIKPYVMGDEDGVPKTPAWAAPRCGVKEWTIKALARQWAKKRTSTAHGCGGAMIRGPYTHECARLEAVLLAMQGLGKPGVTQITGIGGTRSPRKMPLGGPGMGRQGDAGRPFPVSSRQQFTKTRWQEAICEGHTEYMGSTVMSAPPEDQFVKYTYPIPEEEGGTRVRLIWQDHACHGACWNDGNMYFKTVRDSTVECNIIQQPWFENDCIFADILLPTTTNIEDEDIVNGGGEQNLLIYHQAAIPPVGESRSDYEIVCEVAKKMEKYGGRYADLYSKVTGDKTVEQWIESAFEKSGAKGLIASLEELKEKKYVLAPVARDWKEDSQRGCTGDFYDNPDKHPIKLPSGKLELYSERLTENFPDDNERGPYPKYVIGGPGWTHDESLDIENGAEKCKTYPLILQSNHPRWRVHVQHDDIPWLREIPTCKVKGYDGYMYEPVWIHPKDAKARGIKHGDIVKVYNERGIELGGAYISERIIPGAIHMDHGARVDMINCDPADYSERGKKWINRGGTNNNISPYPPLSKNCPGMVVSSFLVEVAKVTGDEMQEWRGKYPEAFARAYDPAYGLLFDTWVDGGMKK